MCKMLGKLSALSSLFLCAFVFDLARCYSVEKFSILMPNVKPNVPELYLCTPVKIDPDNTYHIVGFEPNATMNTAHHILLYGCGRPGSSNPVWNCGEMSMSKDNSMTTAGVCQGESEIIYAWARDAPTLILPDGVGFKVGKNSRVQYLVLQVHYAHIDSFMDGSTDDSGITLHLTQEPLRKLAGVYILGTGGSIPPKSVEYMETACQINENKTMHPFAYRTHTHTLGKIVSGYIVKNNNQWIEIGKRDPMTPQMFYDTQTKMAIHPGDTLAARCTMQSNRETWTYIGMTGKDEMCNFYIMYWVEDTEPLMESWCFTNGPPEYYWNKTNLQNIPDVEASTL